MKTTTSLLAGALTLALAAPVNANPLGNPVAIGPQSVSLAMLGSQPAFPGIGLADFFQFLQQLLRPRNSGGGQGGGGGVGAPPPPPPPNQCQPSNIQKNYFAKIGIGGNYGPHYPCYDQNGVIAQCIDNSGGTPRFVAQDAKNAVIETSIPLDARQLQTAGFKTMRAYGDPPLTWITLIQTVKSLNDANPGQPMGVVYQVSGCPSDASKPDHPCPVAFSAPIPFQTFLQSQLNNLKQVISVVGASTFQSVVKLVIVTNEDLVAYPPANVLNTEDITSAVDKTKTELTNDGIRLTTAALDGVDVSTDVVIGQMLKPEGAQIAAHFTPGGPVMENIYGFQFGDDPEPAVQRLATEIQNMQTMYPDRPAMVGETGWATLGADSRYAQAKSGLPNAISYYQALYPYIGTCSIPTLVFEPFDQPTKAGSYLMGNSDLAEQHYGVLSFNNTAKSRSLLPSPGSSYNDYDTSRGTVFTFTGGFAADGTTPKPDAIKISTIPLGGTAQTITFQPRYLIDATGNSKLFWPTLTLYGPTQDPTPPASDVSLFPSNGGPACINKVKRVNNAPLFDSGGLALRGAFAGGDWDQNGTGLSNCPGVNWKGGMDNISANVFLPTDF